MHALVPLRVGFLGAYAAALFSLGCDDTIVDDPPGSGGSAGAGGTPAAVKGYARNPFVSHIFTADPSAKVFDDRVYVYASHDTDTQRAYDMVDYHVFSSDDLVNWRDHGVVLSTSDVPWAGKFFAPDCCRNPRDGKYYLYFPDTDVAIGVAVSDNPGGPFVDALGQPLISKSTPGVTDVEWVFDPTCFVDDDGQAYLYFGGGMPGTGDNARVIRLNPDMISLADASATTVLAPDFFEASFLHKRGGKYYFSYSTTFATHSATIDYLTSDSPMGGFQYAGTLLPNPAENNSNNNHHSVIEYGGKSYLFYHNRILANRLGDSDYQRSITLDSLTYADDGSIVQLPAVGGRVAQLKSVNGRARVEAESIAAQRGIETDFAIAGGVRAGVAVTEISDGDWIGYSQVDLGVNVTAFHARVASGANSAGKLEVWLDGCDTFTDQPGSVIGSCTLSPTGSTETWADVTCAVTPTNGLHDVCLRATGDTAASELFRLDYFRFE